MESLGGLRQMKNIRIIFACFLLIFLFTACEDASTESNKDTKKMDSEETTDQSETESHTPEETETSQVDMSADRQVVENEILTDAESAKDNTTASLKEEYLQKLQDTKTKVDQIKPEDSSTYALKAVEDYKYEIWDDLLNEIYRVLQEQLTDVEMDSLREKQREWIDYRDATALEASKKYEGGTQEHLEYSAVIAKLTEDRCYVLVEDYMQ